MACRWGYKVTLVAFVSLFPTDDNIYFEDKNFLPQLAYIQKPKQLRRLSKLITYGTNEEEKTNRTVPEWNSSYRWGLLVTLDTNMSCASVWGLLDQEARFVSSWHPITTLAGSPQKSDFRNNFFPSHYLNISLLVILKYFFPLRNLGKMLSVEALFPWLGFLTPSLIQSQILITYVYVKILFCQWQVLNQNFWHQQRMSKCLWMRIKAKLQTRWARRWERWAFNWWVAIFIRPTNGFHQFATKFL